jgi:hypothetical protein
VFAEDDGLLDPASAGNANKVSALFDCTKQRVGEVAVVDELVAEQLKRSTGLRSRVVDGLRGVIR